MSQLPPEIINIIGEYLSPGHLAAFSLSSRRQNEALGSKRRSAMLDRHNQLVFFLAVANDRDRPMDFACIRCCRIHRSAVAEWPSKLSPQRRMCNVFSTYRGFLHYTRSQYQVRFEHIQLVLKEHLYGTGRGLLLEEAFSHTEIKLNLPKLPNFTCMNLVSVEARVVIVNPTDFSAREIYTRCQHWIRVPAYLEASESIRICKLVKYP